MILDHLFTQPLFEAADPSRLIVSITIQPMSSGGEPMQKEIDLTGQFQGSTASQMNQAMDYMSKMLESKGLAFNDLSVSYQGHTINGQNRGAMSPQSDWEKEAEAKAAQMRAQRPKQNATPAIKESKSNHITQFASNAHEEWRRNFDPTGTKPRIKKNSDGTEGDINVPFADLHPDWQKENLAAAHAAHRAVKHFGRDMEKAAEYVHNEWMKRNPKADYNAAQHVPYDDLPDDEKEKDRVHVRTMMQLMGHSPEQRVAVAGFPGAPDVEMPPMKPSGDPKRDKLKQEYIDLHREIKSLVDLQYTSTSDEEKIQAKARIKRLNDRADQIRAILEPRQPPNEWQKKTYGYDDNWNKVDQGVAEAAEKNPHTSALGKALYRDLSKQPKLSPQQVQRNKERWAQRQADKEQGVAEGLPGSLSKSDYTPGATKKHVSTNCTTCHGRKGMYKLDGKLFADNKVGAVRVKCPTCHGTGDKPGVAEGSELKQAKRKYNQAAKDANADQVGAGKKIDTMKNSLRQKDVDNKKQEVAESNTLMKKLHQALLQEGRVKELADDLKTLNDAEFMKKYGKAKAAIRRDMKKVDEGNANSGRRGPNSPPDNTPVKLGRVQKLKTGIKHHADSSRYGGTVPDTDDDHLLSPASRHRLHKAVTPDQQDLDEGNMPQSVIKSKQKYADMSDQEFHAAHKNKSEDDLKNMAWRHGYGKGSNHYVNRHKKGGGQLNELSTNKLAQYKTAAAADAKKADQAGDVKRGNKRFGGIVKATKKQFDNDAKKIEESRQARQALMAQIVNSR